MKRLALFLLPSIAFSQITTFPPSSSGGTGTVTSVATSCGLTGGTITISGTLSRSSVPAAKVGTTYTFANGDCGAFITQSNAAASAFTLPQAGVGGFANGWLVDVSNIGAGTLTITPTTSNVDGAANIILTTNQSTRLVSDGTNYHALRGLGAAGGATALSSITAATAANTLANGNNPQTWNCAQTTDAQDCMTFGETSAATNGTLTNALANQSVFHASTASGSTATPAEIEQLGVTGATGAPLLQLESTWNNASLVGEGILENVTSTLSAATSKLLDLRVGNVAQFTVDKSGNAVGTSFTTTGGPACTPGSGSMLCLLEGTDATNVAGAAVIDANSTSHELAVKTNGSNTPGQLVRSQPTPVSLTGQVATIASGTTLCSAVAGSCNVAGMYRAQFYVASTVSCTTPGPAAIGPITITFTDEVGTKTAQTVPMSINGAAALSVAGMALGNTTNSMFGLTEFWSTGASPIGYGATGYTACTTGTATFSIRAAVERIF